MIRHPFSLPLLGKELVELAAQRRTYAIRALYAALLYTAFILMNWRVWRYAGQTPESLLGRGGDLFEMLVALQFAGIYLFLPAIMAGVITAEKERASLELLFLTDLSPWGLVLQKYLSRLVPVLGFLLLSLPPMAVAYALGGLQSTKVGMAVYLLVLTALQIGAWALLCSTVCRTTVGATMAAYIGGAGYLFAPLVTGFFWYLAFNSRPDEEFMFCFLGPYVLYEYSRAGWDDVVTHSLPIWGTTLLWLVAARVYLVRRAFASPRNVLAVAFRGLDRLFKRWNQAFGNITFGRTTAPVPETDPVAWRETHKRALGQWHHLVRLFLLVEIPAFWLGLWSVIERGNYYRSGNDAIATIIAVIWVLAAVTLTVQGANAFASERTHQTLAVLLTTPVTGEELVRQKMKLLHRLAWVFVVPLLSLVVMEAWGEWDRSEPQTTLGYLAVSVVTLVLYPRVVSWLGLWVGLWMRTKARAVVSALVIVVLWCVVPFLTAILLDEFNHWSTHDVMWVFAPSPVAPIGFAETGDLEQLGIGPCILNFTLTAVLLYVLRRLCLRRADYYLRHE